MLDAVALTLLAVDDLTVLAGELTDVGLAGDTDEIEDPPVVPLQENTEGPARRLRVKRERVQERSLKDIYLGRCSC